MHVYDVTILEVRNLNGGLTALNQGVKRGVSLWWLWRRCHALTFSSVYRLSWFFGSRPLFQVQSQQWHNWVFSYVLSLGHWLTASFHIQGPLWPHWAHQIIQDNLSVLRSADEPSKIIRCLNSPFSGIAAGHRFQGLGGGHLSGCFLSYYG